MRSNAGGAGRARAATILVVEDHLDSRDALRTLLEAFGYQVLAAANGREAIEVASSAEPDLILMDIMMPEIDGFEATRILRQTERTRATPIIAVTAMEGAQRLSIAAGANDFVAKPIDTRMLLAKIESWLVQDAGAPPAEQPKPRDSPGGV